MHLYHEQFSESHDLPRKDKPSKFLIIASTGRCGSHMLGHALQKANSFGFPLEYANPANLAEWEKRLDKQGLNEVLPEIQQRRTSPNGVFGIKVHYSHIKQFGGFDRLKKTFSDAYYIILSRKDVLKQAISLSIAKQTGVWISGQKAVIDNPRYNFNDIDHCLRHTIIENSSWRYTLSAHGCNYIEMDFDFVRSNLTSTIHQIADFIRVEIDPELIPKDQATKKQSNNINIEWERRFLSDYDGKELFSNGESDLLSRLKRKIRRIIYSNVS